MKYAIDANILITASSNTYPENVFPSFWIRLLSFLQSGDVVIIDKVYDEVLVGTDNLSQWLNKNKISKASTGTSSVVKSLAKVTQISQDLVDSGGCNSDFHRYSKLISCL